MASSILKVGFALSKWTDLHRAYVVIGRYSSSKTVCKAFINFKVCTDWKLSWKFKEDAFIIKKHMPSANLATFTFHALVLKCIQCTSTKFVHFGTCSLVKHHTVYFWTNIKIGIYIILYLEVIQ